MENSEEVIVPEKNNKVPASGGAPKRLNKNVILITSAAVLVVAVVVGVILLTNKPSSDSSSSGSTPPGVEVTTVYSTPEDSEDPEADYLNHLDSLSSSAEFSEDALRATLDKASYKISLAALAETPEESSSLYSEAKAILDSIDLEKHSSHSELFQYYNVYSRLYAENALNDSTLYAEYVQKATNERNFVLAESAGE